MAEQTVRVRVAVIDFGGASNRPSVVAEGLGSLPSLLQQAADVIGEEGYAVIHIVQSTHTLPTEPEVAARVEGEE